MEFQRKDYLVRVFQEMGEVLAALLGMRQRHQNERALELIHRTVAGMLGLTPELTEILAPESLLALIDMDPLLDDNHRLMLAELLEAKAEVLGEMNEPDGARAIRALSGEIRVRASTR